MTPDKFKQIEAIGDALVDTVGDALSQAFLRFGDEFPQPRRPEELSALRQVLIAGVTAPVVAWIKTGAAEAPPSVRAKLLARLRHDWAFILLDCCEEDVGAADGPESLQ